MSFDYLFKNIVVGDGAVGKTAATVRYATGTFMESYKMTIGVDFRVKIITLEREKIKLQIWDTGGQERFANVRPLYYRGASGAIVMFDITSRDSFLNLPRWLEEVEKYCGKVPWILVGNKLDLEEFRRVDFDEAESYARQTMNTEYYESSAKDGRNIETIFKSMARKMLEDAKEKKKVTAKTPTVTLTETSVTETSTPPVTPTVTKPPPAISVGPFEYIKETTIPYMLTAATQEVLTQDIELATVFMISENLRTSDETLEAITKIHWPMYIVPYKGGSFLLDGFKIISNELLITQLPTAEEIEKIMDSSELDAASLSLNRVKNALTNRSARKFTVHALHQPSLLKDIIPFIERTSTYKTVPIYNLEPDITLKVAQMFPQEFDNFGDTITSIHGTWDNISDSINRKFNQFQQKIDSLSSKIRNTSHNQLQDLKKEMDQQTISLQVKFEEQLDALVQSLPNKANQSNLESLNEQIDTYIKECEIRIDEQEAIFKSVQNEKEQTITLLESTKEKFNQLNKVIHTLKDRRMELLETLAEEKQKTLAEEKQPETFVIKDYPIQETTQIGLPVYCIKYVRGFSPRFMVIPPLIFSPSGQNDGEQLDKSGKIFTPTSLAFLFKTKIEKKINSSEQFLKTIDVACAEENLLTTRNIKDRIQEGLEELVNRNGISAQDWKWLKTRLDSVSQSS